MAKPKLDAGGGLPAVAYTLRMAREAGGPLRLYRRLRAKNACKTCALGMGGQKGGMVNEVGHFPEVCKKSMQAQVADMRPPIADSFFRETSLDALATLTSAQLERLGRLAFPVAAGSTDSHFRRISWDEALDRAGAALAAAPPDQLFLYVSGRSSNEGAFLAQLVMRAFGTANIHNCSYYCHQASGVALKRVYGSGTASIVLADLARADLAIVTGANPASNHPRLITQLVALRRRGGKVIVINPVRELGLVRFRIPSDPRSMALGSRVSDIYLQPHVGGDLALFKGLLKAVLERRALDASFVAAHTAGWEAVREDVERTPWGEIEAASGVPLGEIQRAADVVAGAGRGICLWAMGLTHQPHGVDSILSVANLALARGWLGRPGAGMLPIRGHSNVQGVGSVGVTPALKASFARRLEERYGITVPEAPGQDTYASMEAARAGKIRAALLLGGNLYASNPDLAWAGEALRNIPVTVSLATTLNVGHIHGRGREAIILPVLARDEEPQPTTQESMFNYVRLSDGGPPNVPGEMRSEVDVLAALAERILPPGRFDWGALRSHRSLREGIAASVPGYAAIRDIEGPGGEFQIEGRTFHAPRFGTGDGRAHFHVTPLPAQPLPEGAFRLMTLRSEGQFNTVVYEEEDIYRGNTRRDVVMMSGADARQLGLAEGDAVRVCTDAGSMRVHVAIIDIRPGNLAMYYPEANAIVPRRLDPASKTPAFKNVVARIEPVA